MSLALRVYHLLPGPARSLAATLHGRKLRAWRYGPETDRLVEEALARDAWTTDQWSSWRGERLARLLHRAATRVPYYRRQWEERRRRGDSSSWEQLEHWPVLTKEPLREEPRSFLADDCQPDSLYHSQTSGTSGKPLHLWHSRDTLRAWYALFEARWRRWNGVSRRDRWAILGGQLVAPVERRKPPFWVWNGALRQLYMSSYHLAPDLIGHYLDALEQHNIRYLWGYSSSLHTLAEGALRLGRTVPMQVALSNAEPLYENQRVAITKAFTCPVRETYGMSENTIGAAECAHGRLHLWPDAGVLEVFDGDQPAASGETGDLVVTGLLNPDMPLIRYQVRDCGALVDLGKAASEEACPCGRRLPVIRSIEGRIDDLLYTADGRRVGRLDPVFKADLPVREVQIVQQALDRLEVRYVPAAGFTDAAAGVITSRLRDRMGPVEVTLRAVSEIPRGANGKFRAVVCNLSEAQRRMVSIQ